MSSVYTFSAHPDDCEEIVNGLTTLCSFGIIQLVQEERIRKWKSLTSSSGSIPLRTNSWAKFTILNTMQTISPISSIPIRCGTWKTQLSRSWSKEFCLQHQRCYQVRYEGNVRMRHGAWHCAALCYYISVKRKDGRKERKWPTTKSSFPLRSLSTLWRRTKSSPVTIVGAVTVKACIICIATADCEGDVEKSASPCFICRKWYYINCGAG